MKKYELFYRYGSLMNHQQLWNEASGYSEISAHDTTNAINKLIEELRKSGRYLTELSSQREVQ